PVYWFKDNLIEIGTKLKKTGVAVDVVNFGDKDGPKGGVLFEPYVPLKDYSYPGESKKENLEALVIFANDNDNSYILYVPEDQQLSLHEHLSCWKSPILSGTRWEQCSSSESIIARYKTMVLGNDLQDKEVEVYLLNSSFEKVQRRA
ncbi:26S proteasome non-ATPase regulatory subunit 4, partial [Tanacetum coccineum]